jgi:hypothetical protein
MIGIWLFVIIININIILKLLHAEHAIMEKSEWHSLIGLWHVSATSQLLNSFFDFLVNFINVIIGM